MLAVACSDLKTANGGDDGGSSGDVGSSGTSGASGTSGDSGTSGSSGARAINCQSSNADSCICVGTDASQMNADTCKASQLQDPGGCCADQGWPSSGTCTCGAFLCYVNSGGGKDCYYRGLGGNGLEVPTTSASPPAGGACCVRLSGICSCYRDASTCQGKPTLASCVAGSVPVCNPTLNATGSPVASCR